MFPPFFIVPFLFYLVNFYPVILHAQPGIAGLAGENKPAAFVQDRLFDDEEILHFKLTGKCNELFNDRNDNRVYHPMLLQYKREDGSLLSVQIRIQTRGNFRRKKENCTLPPLLLNFPKSAKIKNNIFEDQNKLKLVMPCKGEEYVIREWLVYKLYNLITEKSFKARLAQVEFEDSLKKRKTETHYCILLEDEKKLAKRNKMFIWDRTKVAMHKTDKEHFIKMAVFQFMIGNTDWSVPYLQNIKLITIDSAKAPYTIPYDFDHAGIVDAPYALPAEELGMSSTKERRYRGYCDANKTSYAEITTFFNGLKDDFYGLYTNSQLLSAKYVKFVTKFLDDFYRIINNGRALKYELENPCRQSNRIEIKGLKER